MGHNFDKSKSPAVKTTKSPKGGGKRQSEPTGRAGLPRSGAACAPGGSMSILQQNDEPNVNSYTGCGETVSIAANNRRHCLFEVKQRM